jgi:hypothetical protein
MIQRSAKIASAIATILCAGAASAATTTFAVVGDYGNTTNATTVANRLKTFNPDFVATVGDNTYSTSNNTANWDAAIGSRYGSYIKYPTGSNSAYANNGRTTNKFFPALGNHDFDVGNSAASFTNYFDLPNNERYYSTVQGNVELFVLSSDPRDPGGVTVGSAQYNWFRNAIAQSTAQWQVVTFHHPFQTSTTSSHGPSNYMNWGFETMGVDMVLQGHNHTMERLSYGNIPWFVTGAGGQSHYSFTNISPNSQFRNSTAYGFSFITATESSLTHQFINTSGTVLDTFTVVPAPGFASLALASLASVARRRR